MERDASGEFPGIDIIGPVLTDSRPSPTESVPLEFREARGAFSRLGHALLRARYSIGWSVGAWPSLFFLLYRVGRREVGLLVSRRTQLVIEGFPRSGNTFAVTAFSMAQGRPVRLARHVHSPAQVLWAVARGIPCLVVIRDPLQAAISLVIRHPYLRLQQALRSYVRFYTAIERLGRGYVLASFAEITADFGEVTRRINARFGTRFLEFEHSDENVARAFTAMENWQRAHGARDPGLLEQIVPRPSGRRRERSRELEQLAASTELRDCVRAAEETYRRMLSLR